MSQGKSVPPEVALYLQARLRDLFDNGASPTQVADRVGVTKGQISQLKNHAKGVGYKTLKGMGQILKLSIDQIETASAAWGKEHPDLVAAFRGEHLEYPERYPNRLLAAEFARRSGVAEEAVLSVLAWALKAGQDPSPAEWFEDMKSEERRLKRDATDARSARGHALAHTRKEQLQKARELVAETKGSIPEAKK